MDNKTFSETVTKIEMLGKIDHIAWHIHADDEPNAVKNVIIAADTDGKQVNIVLTDPVKYPDNAAAVNTLVLLLLCKAYKQSGKSINSDWFCILNDPVAYINRMRKEFPYVGKRWINEEQSKLYDHVVPEFMF